MPPSVSEPALTGPPVHRRQSPARAAWRRRCIALLLGVGFIAAAELLCIAFGWGEPRELQDPYVGFERVEPLFVTSEDGRRMETSEVRTRFFAPVSFDAGKKPATFRIFVLGGSTVQGRPYSVETSFTTWLALQLQVAAPSRRFEVVNCGGISYASYRLAPILDECLAYEPDLFIIMTGHNEFLESRTYAPLREAPALVRAARATIGRMRLYRLFRSAARAVAGADEDHDDDDPPVTLKTEVDTVLDGEQGADAYERDDAWRRGVVNHFEFNLHRMAARAHAAGATVLFILPPSNLSGTPPFKSQHRDGLREADEAAWSALVADARNKLAGDAAEALALLRRAETIDDQYAAMHYLIGQAQRQLGRHADARRSFIRARDLDICPLRMTSELADAMRRVAAQRGLPMLDAHALLEATEQAGTLGDAMLVDHVHPTFEGHQHIAQALFDLMCDRGWIESAGVDPGAVAAAWQRHFQSLDHAYFLKGRRELAHLNAWARKRREGQME